MSRFLRFAVIALLAGAVLAVSPGWASARTPAVGQTLVVRNTMQGSQVAGVVSMSYRSGGQTVRHTCTILQCVFTVPSRATVSLKQRSQDPARIHFLDWKVLPLGGKIYLFKKPNLVLVMKRGYTVTAEFISAKR